MQAYLREHRPPTLIVWDPHDGYMPEGAARAYLRDLTDAELHLLEGGHWLLQTQLDEVVAPARDFLARGPRLIACDACPESEILAAISRRGSWPRLLSMGSLRLRTSRPAEVATCRART